MSIGSKIKGLRKKSGMTQDELSSGIITRGMLSRIENGDANPSMKSLIQIANRLDVSPSFLLEEGIDILPAELEKVAATIEKEYHAKNYENCLKIFTKWQLESDKRFLPVFITCAFEVAIKAFYCGNFAQSKALLNRINELSPLIVFPSASIPAERISFLINLMDNIDSINNLTDIEIDFIDFEFSPSLFISLLKLLKSGNRDECETILKYTHLDDIYKKFIASQILIKDYRFIDSILQIKEIYSKEECPLFLKLLCLSSIENCCKLCEDYKGAYENHLEYQTLLSRIIR